MAKKKTVSKLQKHIVKGDELMASKKAKKALKEYRRAMEIDPDTDGLYDKLIHAHDEATCDWDVEDLAESVSWTMKKQEKENPYLKQVHAKLSPEWKKASELAIRIMMTEDGENAKKLTEELVAMGEIATRALVGLLSDFKKVAKHSEEK